MTPSHTAERTHVGHKANIHAALPATFSLVKRKVFPTGRQVNMSPALLVCCFSIIFRVLQRLTCLIQNRDEVGKTRQQLLREIKGQVNTQ